MVEPPPPPPRGRPPATHPRRHKVTFYLTDAEWARLTMYRASFARRPPRPAVVARQALLAFLAAAGIP
jgi:hypothetical protein